MIAYYMLIDNYFQLPRTIEQTFSMYNEYIYNESNVKLPSDLISVLKLSFFWYLLAICVLFSCYSVLFHSFIQSFDMYSHNSTYLQCKYMHDEFNLATVTFLVYWIPRLFLWTWRNLPVRHHAKCHCQSTKCSTFIFLQLFCWIVK